MENNNLLIIIILVFILGYMVNSMCDGRLVEGVDDGVCSGKKDDEGWGTIEKDNFGNKLCIKCQTQGMGVNATGECTPCYNADDAMLGLDTNYNCKHYNANDNYYRAIYTVTGETDFYYKQSINPEGSCSQSGWGSAHTNDDDNSTCGKNRYCMKKNTENTKQPKEQQCHCFSIPLAQANSGFLAESSYYGEGYSDRAPPEKYVQCSTRN
jgi:hypothetical protein